MVCVPIKGGVVTFSKKYKPGDLPPEGYLDWHEWADVQYKAGIRQSYCDKCGGNHTPQELPCNGIRRVK